MDKKVIRWWGVSATILLSLSCTNIASASESSDFTVVPNIPRNQEKQSVGYWWLKVKPKSVQKLKLTISNNSSDTKKFNISTNTAITNENMTVDYTQSDQSVGKYFTAKKTFSFSKMSRVNNKKPGVNTVEVKGGDSEQVSISLKVPVTKFKGLLVGGVNVTEVPAVSNSKTSITNIFGYTYAVVLQESNKLPKPNIKVKSIHYNEKDKLFKFRLLNKSNNLAKDVKVSATVINNKNQKVSTYQSKSGTLVPQASVPLGITNQKIATKPGTYKVKIHVEGSKFKALNVTRKIQIKN